MPHMKDTSMQPDRPADYSKRPLSFARGGVIRAMEGSLHRVGAALNWTCEHFSPRRGRLAWFAGRPNQPPTTVTAADCIKGINTSLGRESKGRPTQKSEGASQAQLQPVLRIKYLQFLERHGPLWRPLCIN
jgi:hypothetical protein